MTWYPAEVVTGPSSTVTVSTSYAGARLGVYAPAPVQAGSIEFAAKKRWGSPSSNATTLGSASTTTRCGGGRPA